MPVCENRRMIHSKSANDIANQGTRSLERSSFDTNKVCSKMIQKTLSQILNFQTKVEKDFQKKEEKMKEILVKVEKIKKTGNMRHQRERSLDITPNFNSQAERSLGVSSSKRYLKQESLLIENSQATEKKIEYKVIESSQNKHS